MNKNDITKEKCLTAEQIFKTKKVGDLIILKSTFQELKIIEFDTYHHCALSFFSAYNKYQEIKSIIFLDNYGEKLTIHSHDGIAGYTALINSVIYKESQLWHEYIFMCGDVYKKNQILNYKQYLLSCLINGDINKHKYNELLLSVCEHRILNDN